MSKTNNTAGIKYDVTGIGNAIVDVLSFVDEAYLTRNELAKGSMQLVDEERSRHLYSQMGQATECSGGSVANSLAGLASLGARTAFIGKVKQDQLGSIFTHDMHTVGVHFSSKAATDGPATANCLVCVTPDAQRTMATFIGACSNVSEIDIDVSIIEQSAVLYIEGYLWDTEHAKAAIRKGMKAARAAGRKVAFTLSDTFCVDRHRDEFLEMIKNDIDILFANESEAKSLFQTENFDEAANTLRGMCSIVAITRSEKGSVVLASDGAHDAPAQTVHRVIDTTGAGDLYASGFLFGYTRGWDMGSCAMLGNCCAAEIIQQLGARSLRPLRELVA
jgi:sugar/nucleoside kinase (ribokinase family)